MGSWLKSASSDESDECNAVPVQCRCGVVQSNEVESDKSWPVALVELGKRAETNGRKAGGKERSKDPARWGVNEGRDINKAGRE